MTPSASFLPYAQTGTDLEKLNRDFWLSLLEHVRVDCPRDGVFSVMDVGCDRGGLLELLAKRYEPNTIVGIEPLRASRQRATFRLNRLAPDVRILNVDEWDEVAPASIDLAVSHEVLHLVADSAAFMRSLSRVIKPGGKAFVVLGCHTENPLWGPWRERLIELGYQPFNHAPMELLKDASAAGFHTSIRPLRRDGWVVYDPLQDGFHYRDIREMLDHHYRYKLLFRLVRSATSATQ